MIKKSRFDAARNSLTVILAGCLLLMLPAGAFATAKTDYDHSIKFEKYQTYAWKTHARPGNGIVNNSIVATRLENAVNEQLMKKGMREDDRNPDVYIVAHLGARNVSDIQYMPAYGWRHWGWTGSDVLVNRYVKGTTVIDIVDARTNRLIWRAIETDTGSNVLDVQSAKKVDKMAADAFKHFPPKV
jgi:uncharacterized protein DUF4136